MLNRIMAACGIIAIFVIATGARADDYRPGPYAGISVGYAVTPSSAGAFDISADGYNVGGLVGLTIVNQGLVMGLEADIALHKVTGSAGAVNFDSRWFASVRGRLGLPMGPALPYVTAGIALSDQTLAAAAGSVDTMRYGPIAGAGVDLQITNTLVARIEATRTWWMDSKFGQGAGFPSVSSTDNQIRAALIFDLN